MYLSETSIIGILILQRRNMPNTTKLKTGGSRVQSQAV